MNTLSQAMSPALHVCSFPSPGFPQFLNQEPPRAQQLRLPVWPTVPHVLHTGPVVVLIGGARVTGLTVAVGVGMRASVTDQIVTD